MDKRLSLTDAAGWIATGSMLALGGVTNYRRPVAFVRALLQRHSHNGSPSNLTLLAFTAGFECDLLVGAGLVSCVRSCYFGLEIYGFAPMFTHLANQKKIEVLEETEASIAFGLQAQMANVGFMPGRGWIGTDLMRLRPDVRTILDPYTDETYAAFPAIKPDIAVIHALQADPDGNAVIGDNKGVDLELCVAADKVIITAEEIVEKLNKADIVAPFVDAVVSAPYGAAPTSCHPVYPVDGAFLLRYIDRVSDPESFAGFITEWQSWSQ
jgi:glutaconate CoA-transferase subunit A